MMGKIKPWTSGSITVELVLSVPFDLLESPYFILKSGKHIVILAAYEAEACGDKHLLCLPMKLFWCFESLAFVIIYITNAVEPGK